MEAVLTRLAAIQDSRLRRFEVFDGGFTLNANLDPVIVAVALTKMETNGLVVRLDPGQLTALFSRICHHNDPRPIDPLKDLRLNELLLYHQDLSLVPLEVLEGAIPRLEKIQFIGGMMTGAQAALILTLARERRLGRIKSIRLVRLTGMRSVPPSLLQEARLNNKLQWID